MVRLEECEQGAHLKNGVGICMFQEVELGELQKRTAELLSRLLEAGNRTKGTVLAKDLFFGSHGLPLFLTDSPERSCLVTASVVRDRLPYFISDPDLR